MTNKIDSFVELIKPNNDDEKIYCNEEACKECRGVCCKNMGCCISPDDLKSVDYDSLKKLLDTGLVSIDWYESLDHAGYSENGYYLRMRNQNADVIDPAYCGVCSILTNNGCPLDFKHRPKGGRLLNANTCENKDPTYSNYECALDWIPHFSILKRLINKYDN